MKVFHFSDNHGHFDILEKVTDDIDLVLSTGDFFPNASRGNCEVEVPFQKKWFSENFTRFQDFLGNKHFALIPGNHDYICLAEQMAEYGYCGKVTKISTGGVEIDGLKFAGFREVPFIIGEWNGETQEQEMQEIVEKTFLSNPDILVTHTPAYGILDDNYGCRSLGTALTYTEHRISHHFFGHNHKFGGYESEEMGIKFHNNATTFKVVSITV